MIFYITLYHTMYYHHTLTTRQRTNGRQHYRKRS